MLRKLLLASTALVFIAAPLRANADFLAPGDAPKQKFSVTRNPGTATQVLHGGNTPTYGPLSLPNDTNGVLPIAKGGTGSAGPAGVTAGSGISVSGAFPNQTVNATGFALPAAFGKLVTNGSGGLASSQLLDVIAGGADPTNVTDARGIVQGLLTTAAGASGNVAFPCGKFKINSSMSITVAAAQHVLMTGGGQGCTQLNFASGAGLTVHLATLQSSFHMRDMDMRTNGAGTANGVTVILDAPFLGGTENQNDFENVTFLGTDGPSQTKYWTSGVNIVSAQNFMFLNTIFFGGQAPGPSGIGVQISGTGDCTTTAGCAAGEYTFIGAQFLINFIGLNYGHNTQGVNIGQSAFIGNSYGINVPAGATNDLGELTISGTGFDNIFYSIFAQSAISGVNVSNSFFIIGRNSGGVGIGGSIYSSSITGSTFTAIGGSTQCANLSGDADVILGNNFKNCGLAAAISGTNGVIGPNAYSGNSTNSSPASTSGTIKVY